LIDFKYFFFIQVHSWKNKTKCLNTQEWKKLIERLISEIWEAIKKVFKIDDCRGFFCDFSDFDCFFNYLVGICHFWGFEVIAFWLKVKFCVAICSGNFTFWLEGRGFKPSSGYIFYAFFWTFLLFSYVLNFLLDFFQYFSCKILNKIWILFIK